MTFTYNHHRRRMQPDARIGTARPDPILDGLAKQIAYQNPGTREFMFKAVSFVAMGCVLAVAWQTFTGMGRDR